MLKMLFNPYIVASFSEKDLASGASNIYQGIDLIENGMFMGAAGTCDVP